MFDLTGKMRACDGRFGRDRRRRSPTRAARSGGDGRACRGRGSSRWRRWRRNLGARVHVLPCNLSDAAAVEALPKQAAEAMGSVDILVNNAGITRDNLFMRMSDEEWASVIDVNLTSTFRLCRGVLRGMMKARWGRIVNISSVVGATGNPGQANYAASKAGMVGHVEEPRRTKWPAAGSR